MENVALGHFKLPKVKPIQILAILKSPKVDSMFYAG